MRTALQSKLYVISVIGSSTNGSKLLSMKACSNRNFATHFQNFKSVSQLLCAYDSIFTLKASICLQTSNIEFVNNILIKQRWAAHKWLGSVRSVQSSGSDGRQCSHVSDRIEERRKLKKRNRGFATMPAGEIDADSRPKYNLWKALSQWNHTSYEHNYEAH